MKPGQVLGDRFLITRVIAGGMGIVYFAVDLSREYEGPLVLKTIRPDLADADGKRRFELEAKIWIRLQAGHFMVALRGIVRVGEMVFIVMPQMSGGTLRDKLERGIPAYIDTITWMTQLLIAMRRLGDEEGLIHRDIKPENILLDDAGDAFITDLGIARDIRSRIDFGHQNSVAPSQLSATQGFVGTILYAAPEQFQGREVDTCCDIWAFGAVFYELLTGLPPFISVGIAALVDKVCNQPLPDEWNNVAEVLPAPVSKIILKCLAKHPTQRYRNFDALLRDWDDLIYILGNSPSTLGDSRITITHPEIELAWHYHFAHRRDRVWVSHSRSRWAALKRCSEYRKLSQYDEAAICAATALSDADEPLLLANLLFVDGYEAHVESVQDPAKRINFPPASVMIMLLHQWMLSRVGPLIDGVELAPFDRTALHAFSSKLLEKDLGLVDLLNTAAQAMHLLKEPLTAAKLIQRAMALRINVADWQVHLAIEASRRTRDELRQVVADIVGKFSDSQDARAKFLCASACQRIGKWDFAAQFWEANFDLDPTNLRALTSSRDCYTKAGWDDEAERITTKLRSLRAQQG